MLIVRRIANIHSWMVFIALPIIVVVYNPQPLRLGVILEGYDVRDYSLSSRIFIISTAALATEVPGPKMQATPAL